jgi:hypothetical protein
MMGYRYFKYESTYGDVDMFEIKNKILIVKTYHARSSRVDYINRKIFINNRLRMLFGISLKFRYD